MIMPKISVIIPVYNVEKYIERCARSLFEQTLDDIEYLFIDDCTPDKSIEVLQKVLEDYPKRKSLTRIIKMSQNSRQAAARKMGMQLSTGDYVIHCDSDDWVDTTLYELMYNRAIQAKVDVVVCPIRDEYVDYGNTRPLVNLKSECREVVKNWYKECVGMFTWNKLVKRSIYFDNDIYPFDGINMWEDNGLMLRIMYYGNGLSYIEDAVYHYNQSNLNSLTNGYDRSAIDQMINCASLLGDFFASKKDCDNFENTLYALQFLAKLNLVTDRFDWLAEFHKIFPKSNVIIKYIKKNAFTTKGYIRFLFVKYHLAWLFVCLFKLKGLVLK